MLFFFPLGVAGMAGRMQGHAGLPSKAELDYDLNFDSASIHSSMFHKEWTPHDFAAIMVF